MTHGRSWLLLVLALLMLAAIPAAPAIAQTRFVFANESPYDTLDPHAAFDTLTVCFEGLFMHRIAGHGDPDPRTVFDAVVRGTFHGNDVPTAVTLS